jgi:serine/threonine-protein kinase
VLDALSALHAVGVVHRDVKPENIVVTADGRGGARPVLIDFGAARFHGEAEHSVSPTHGGVLLGTPAYMAPEHVQGRGGFDPRSDVYSAGITLYELITGSSPYQRDTEGATLHAIQTEGIRSPSRILPTISPALEAVILVAMARDPEDRFASPTIFVSFWPSGPACLAGKTAPACFIPNGITYFAACNGLFNTVSPIAI